MKKIVYLIILLLLVFSCKSTQGKRSTSQKKTNTNTAYYTNSTAEKIIQHAKSFEGVRYQYGGNSKKGMDCSGLVYNVFTKENINTPRTTTELAKTGNWIDLKKVQAGDLLFFATKKNSRVINHVAIATTPYTNQLEFIHATTSKGVIISNLAERYWYFAFVQARRILK